jgi:hypothetical protein
MEPFNVTNHDHNEGPYLRLKKKRKEHPHPQKEVEEKMVFLPCVHVLYLINPFLG